MDIRVRGDGDWGPWGGELGFPWGWIARCYRDRNWGVVEMGLGSMGRGIGVPMGLDIELPWEGDQGTMGMYTGCPWG